MYVLYALTGEKWHEFATFGNSLDYGSQIENAAKIKKNTAAQEATRNAAIVMESFVLAKKQFGAKYGKLVKRALRHFDEVGISNEIFDSLEELLDEGCDAFALAQAGERVENFPQGDMDVQI